MTSFNLKEYNDMVKDNEKRIQQHKKSWIAIVGLSILLIGILCIDKCLASRKESSAKPSSDLIYNKSLQNTMKKPTNLQKTIGYFNVKKPLNKSKGLRI